MWTERYQYGPGPRCAPELCRFCCSFQFLRISLLQALLCQVSGSPAVWLNSMSWTGRLLKSIPPSQTATTPNSNHLSLCLPFVRGSPVASAGDAHNGGAVESFLPVATCRAAFSKVAYKHRLSSLPREFIRLLWCLVWGL